MAEDILIPPDEYLCPITHELMENPVVAADGFTYERSAITLWLEKGHHRSPMTNDRLLHNSLTPNLILKRLIDNFKQKLPLVQLENQVKVSIEEAVSFKEEVMRQAIEMNNKRNQNIEDILAEERAKMERLANEIEELKQRIPENPVKSKNSQKAKNIAPPKANQIPNKRSSIDKPNSQPKAAKKAKNSNAFSINFKTLAGHNFTLQVDKSDTVAKIKDKIFDLEGIPQVQQGLIFQGRQWTDEESMLDYDIQDDSVVHLVLRLPNNSCENHQPQPRPRKSNRQPKDIVIYVKTLTGATIEFNVNSADSVESLKNKVQDHEGIPPPQQRLIFGGQEMEEDDWSLEDYDVKNESTIHLVLKLRGC